MRYALLLVVVCWVLLATRVRHEFAEYVLGSVLAAFGVAWAMRLPPR